jgi:predicted RNA-binding Zn ribbon-like protein
LAGLRKLRETFRAAMRARHAGRPDWNQLIELLNAILRRSPRVQALHVTRNGLALNPVRELGSPSDLMGLIAAEIAEFVAGPELAHARPCRSSACVLWFVDRTRNHSRHWCRMERCGARAKARAYYQRSKQDRRRVPATKVPKHKSLPQPVTQPAAATIRIATR